MLHSAQGWTLYFMDHLVLMLNVKDQDGTEHILPGTRIEQGFIMPLIVVCTSHGTVSQNVVIPNKSLACRTSREGTEARD